MDPATRRRLTLARWARRGLLAAAVGAALAFGPAAVRQAWYVRDQTACLRYAPPGDQVVLSIGTPVPTASGQYRTLAPRTFRWPTTRPTPSVPPPVLARTLPAELPVVGADLFVAGNDAVAFMHRRAAAGGDDRLVVVFAKVNEVGERGHQVTLHGRASRPGSVWPGSRATKTTPRSMGLNLFAHEFQSLRVFAGQADPADRSHFTIGYEVGGLAGVVDGWVRSGPAGESVDLISRQGTPAWADAHQLNVRD